jgi:hypothetical protein
MYWIDINTQCRKPNRIERERTKLKPQSQSDDESFIKRTFQIIHVIIRRIRTIMRKSNLSVVVLCVPNGSTPCITPHPEENRISIILTAPHEGSSPIVKILPNRNNQREVHSFQQCHANT